MSNLHPSEIRFHPTPDVQAALLQLATMEERRRPSAQMRRIRAVLHEMNLPAYFDQTDPNPRLAANHQFQQMETAGWLRLEWVPGEQNNLLEAITLLPGHLQNVCTLLDRQPLGEQRARLSGRLRAELFRLTDWRLAACRYVLHQLDTGHTPAPFRLGEDAFNEDLLAALVALQGIREETAYRVFSVRTFNDSKRLEELLPALVRLGHFGCSDWKPLNQQETLREMWLEPNPSYLYLQGAWKLVTNGGEILSLSGFDPAVGFPARQAALLQRVTVGAPAVLCIENATSFYAFTRRTGGMAGICLWGNPSPACRHLLRQLAEQNPTLPLYVWADIDYGGLNILSCLRRTVSPRFTPYLMDGAILSTYHAQSRPLTPNDRQLLQALTLRPELDDVRSLIMQMLHHGVKLEQEAVEIR